MKNTGEWSLWTKMFLSYRQFSTLRGTMLTETCPYWNPIFTLVQSYDCLYTVLDFSINLNI